MTENQTERLIQLVQAHPCLYNRRDKDYRNTIRKDYIWDKIAKELQQNRETAKGKWKNLKDGYTKFKKQNKVTTSQQRYANWVWGPYLEFLDFTLKDSSRKMRVDVDVVKSETVCWPEVETSMHSSSRSPPSNASPQFVTADVDFFAPSSPHSDDGSKKRRLGSQDEENHDLDYLKQKNYDAVDYLFTSYAETFRKLKPRTQAEVKMKLAQVFAEAEIKDLD
ncbi:uncharacterized protein LOC126374024 [Pectinophora gossypiella]|uniref:MADF domain-containing protein n=1 Tax=Pectinophora gossypiella TaxID=13191 RepID=A0A1E1WE40_PECGO|nr:uncharacterized protein LOC126374024 [Pectinophora gossypiella]